MKELTRSKLYRSNDNRMVAGVCGGLAEWIGWDPTIVRVLFVVASLLSAAVPGVLLYFALWVILPERRSTRVEAPLLDDSLRSTSSDVAAAAR